MPVTIGLDEVGTGAWAGPALVAAVRIANGVVPDVRDSKTVPEAERYRLADAIEAAAEFVFVAARDADAINARGIRECWREAVAEAAHAARRHMPDASILMDGSPDYDLLRMVPFIAFEEHGDDSIYQIAAASLVAKARRDRLMIEADGRHPGYGWAKNKGYGVPFHVDAIRRMGMCPLHRRSMVEHALARSRGADRGQGIL